MSTTTLVMIRMNIECLLEVLTSYIRLYSCPNLILTMLLLQSHPCSTTRRQHLPSRPFVST
jgi:hypothetical protein